LNLLAPVLLYAKYQCILASGSKEDFKRILSLLNKPIYNFVPLGCGHFLSQGLYLKKLESPDPKDDAPC